MLKNLSEIIKNNQIILILLIINFTIFNISSNFQINKFKDIPFDSKKLPKLNIILNDVGKSGLYGYKYGYQYGYQYAYNYGYNYGYNEDKS